MHPVIVSIAALLLSAALLQPGNGLQFTLLPIRADFEGFGPATIAFFGSGYSAGDKEEFQPIPRTTLAALQLHAENDTVNIAGMAEG